MSKKKKSNSAHQSQSLSPERFIREKARQLPIEACYMTQDLRSGLGSFIVVRKHKNEKYTVGYYLVDTFCRGVVNTGYRLRMDADEYKDFIDEWKEKEKIRPVEYAELHNWIYGAVEFAEDAGLEPMEDFELTEYLLEEDTDDIPLMKFEYGKDGRHCLLADNRLEASYYIPTMIDHLGYDFTYTTGPADHFHEADEWDDGKEDEDDRINNLLFRNYPRVEYCRDNHPDYPAVLNLENAGLQDKLIGEKVFTTKEEVDELLSLPHDSLKRDLEHYIMYEIGRTYKEIPEEDEYMSGMLPALVFLGEVGDDDSLDVVLEVMRCNDDSYDYHFGDYANETLVPVLYKLGRNQLDKLTAYCQEPGLDSYFKTHVFGAVAQIGILEPERRDEIVAWLREMAHFAIEQLPNNQCFDAMLAGFLICAMMDIEAKELFPEIEALFDTELVDPATCGRYDAVKREMGDGYHSSYNMDIHDFFSAYNQAFS